MYYVYIIYSPLTDKFYIGQTQNLESRLSKHNTKHDGFSSQAKDWEIKYYETFNTRNEAINREKQIKSWKSRIMLEKLCNFNK